MIGHLIVSTAMVESPNKLLPEGTIGQRMIIHAEAKLSKTEVPYVFCRLDPSGVMTLGPFDYYEASKQAGLSSGRPARVLKPFGEIWKCCPPDPKWLVGALVEFKVDHHKVNDVVYQSFRFKRFV